MSHAIERRQFLGLSLAGLATAALAGCGVGGTGGNTSSTNLGVAWYGGDPVHAAMQTVLNLYTAKNPKVAFTPQHAAFNDYWPKIATETAARDAPDVMRMSLTYFTDYAERGALLDLSSYIGKTIDISAMSPGVAESGVVNGKRYGIGQSSIANAMFANTDVITSIGAPKPDPEWTWDTFATWAASVHSASGGKVFGSQDQAGHFELFEPFVRQHGGTLFSSDNKKLAAGKDLIEQWWAYWAQMRSTNAAPPTSVTAQEAGFDTNPVVKGISAVSFGWVQQITFLQPLMKQNLEIITPPTVANGSPGLYVDSQDMWSVAATTKGPNQAAEFINFMLNDDAAVKAIGVVLGVPPSSKATGLLNLTPSTPAGKAVAYAEALGKSKKVSSPPAPWPKGYSQISALFGKTAQDIGFGKSTPTQGAADFSTQANQILAQ